MSALITNKKSPNVRIVTGNVNKTIMGLMKRLSNPKTIATIKDVVKFATCTPFIKWAMTITKIAVTIILRKIMIIRFE